MSFQLYDGVDVGQLAASADLSAHQYKLVKISSGEIALCGDGEDALGILQNKPDAQGKECKVRVGGISKLKIGGTLAAGAVVTSSAAGLAVAAASGKREKAQLLVAGVANDIVAAHVYMGEKTA